MNEGFMVLSPTSREEHPSDLFVGQQASCNECLEPGNSRMLSTSMSQKPRQPRQKDPPRAKTRRAEPSKAQESRTQRERTDTSKRELLGAALDLVAERGYRGA